MSVEHDLKKGVLGEVMTLVKEANYMLDKDNIDTEMFNEKLQTAVDLLLEQVF